jgi:TatD DNase family protein
MHLDLSKNYRNLIKVIEKHNMMVVSMTNHPKVYKRFSKMISSNNIRVALGLHPEIISKYPDSLNEMLKLLPTAKYIGEIGLDLRGKSFDEKNIQVLAFDRIIQSCYKQGGKLLSIHSRGSVQKILSSIPKDFTCSVIFHWYSGNEKNIIEAIRRGYYFSINVSMLKSRKFMKLLELIPKNRILIETDYPFIDSSVESYVQQIEKTVSKLAEYYNVDNEVIINQIEHNFVELIKYAFN